MTTSPAPRPIAALDVPLPTLRERMAALVAKQKQDAAVQRLRLLLAEQPHRPATPGELKEQRHWLHDADPDSTFPAIRVDLTKHQPEGAS